MATKRQMSKMAKAVAEVGDRTGNFLERTDPGKATRALEMLADGESFRTIQKELGLQWDTVARLKARHKVLLDERRAVLAEDALEIAEGLRLLQKEKMRMLAEDPEQLARTNIRDLSIPWGIANDKFLAAVGENKVVVEHKSAAPSLEDAMRAIQEAREKLKIGAVEILTKDVTNEPSDSGS